METVVFIEEMGRNGDVVKRHAIKQLPVCIGRGYEADVIIDDPHVAAKHLEIRWNDDGLLEAVDLGSLNGTHRVSNMSPISTARIHGDALYRIGKTHLRIRLAGHPVSPELQIPKIPWSSRSWILVALVGLNFCFVAWNNYIKNLITVDSEIYSLPILTCVVLFVWSASWALVCRILHGSGNFVTHGITAFLGFAAIILVEKLTEYIEFAYDLHGLNLFWFTCSGVVLATMLYNHLRLSVRIPPYRIASLSVFLAVILYGVLYGLPAMRDADKPGLQFYNSSIKSSVFVLDQGITLDQFEGIANQLKTKADRDADF
jgi:hypothetical protein